ncbi:MULTISPECIES: toprim domain-containing protein [unclassified Mesorhizobium]|uniref:toprim domain-containing protein n=1 Tax=unclassified Mesorhizobium TaxID=325217 RepID=UPI000FCB1A84|nr:MULTISPECIES: toprim domain-containing protein [unclassified Mesorhizobium]RUV57643.1 hypothetical protein EOA85_15530 [Mesorhizobium sp. M5C.F.Ca.IN.020.29.1.1]TIM52770.1 MAG: hypothetical protein E5Y46_31045 [Mesorhizobium sp.]TIM86952.1 MAG: hypothetical protein E5Y50_13925 [Mesorhizobium sp.]TIR28896.1 MAG: hypothetical protein E5X35_29015 [Mesorhizobium sp.]TIS21606.1 MAG: hypothetical protein E5X07_21775 [Mesorhizobium sp.]
MTVAERISFREVKAALLDKLDGLVSELFPDGDYDSKSKRKYWLATNPSRNDTKPGSFWIYMSGPKQGGYCDSASGQKGDVFGLIQLKRGGSILDAKIWGQWWCGLDPNEPPEQREQRAIAADQRKRQAIAEAAAQLDRDRRTAHAIWLHGIPLALKGGVRNPAAALAFAYFEKRGIDLDKLPRLPGVTRLLLDQRHVESGQTFAALGSCIIGADHKFMALHRVFITDQAEKIDLWTTVNTPDGPKQKQLPVRKSWPDYLGGFIPVWDGGTNMSARKQAATGELTPAIACEGIEDGFAAAIGNQDHRVRAACSLGNLHNMPLFACDDRLIVWRDNDWGKPQAERQLQAACKELAERGRDTGTEVFLASSYLGKDANDLMKGK